MFHYSLGDVIARVLPLVIVASLLCWLFAVSTLTNSIGSHVDVSDVLLIRLNDGKRAITRSVNHADTNRSLSILKLSFALLPWIINHFNLGRGTLRRLLAAADDECDGGEDEDDSSADGENDVESIITVIVVIRDERLSFRLGWCDVSTTVVCASTTTGAWLDWVHGNDRICNC